MIPLTRPWLGAEEEQAACEVLRSGMLVQGEHVARFERLLAERCGRRHAIAVSSGTAALELALRAIGIGPGDEVLLPNLTWPSPAHAALRLGGRVRLVEVDAREWNATEEGFAAARTSRTRAAIAIDQFGNPARRRAIEAALDGIPIVEDAACALGSRFDDGPCASMGAIACLSFHPRKILTTGEGGACLTDDDELAERLRVLRNHGQEAPGVFREPAGNYRLTELAAAVGISQMSRLDEILVRRSERAARYRALLPELVFQAIPAGATTNHQTCGALLPTRFDSDTRAAFVERLRARGVQVGPLSYALHRVPTVAGGAQPGERYLVSEALADRGIALPLYPQLTFEEQDVVIAAIQDALATEARR